MRINITKLCRCFDRSRQALYKAKDQNDLKEQDMILKNVQEIRRTQPCVGTRKLKDHLASQGIVLGRDRLFGILRQARLLIKPKRRYQRTTYSRHRFKAYTNLLKTHTVTGPDQAYASDITYVATDRGYCYLFLITDIYSRKIVGHCLHKDLTVHGALIALCRAIAQKRPGKEFIHHSDRGVQYCCHDYVDLIESHQGRMSMTEENHVYENALAERVNGILKNELLPDRLPHVEASHIVDHAIGIYNNQRLHNSLGNRTPQRAHNN